MRFVMLAILLLSTAVGAQEPASFSVSVMPDVVRVGETATVWIDVTLGDDSHIYSATTPEGGPYPTEFSITGKEFVQNGPVVQPPPIKEHDPNFDMMVEYYNKSGVDLLANTNGVPTEGFGFSTYTMNNGKMRNRGFELTLSGDVIMGKRACPHDLGADVIVGRLL